MEERELFDLLVHYLHGSGMRSNVLPGYQGVEVHSVYEQTYAVPFVLHVDRDSLWERLQKTMYKYKFGDGTLEDSLSLLATHVQETIETTRSDARDLYLSSSGVGTRKPN